MPSESVIITELLIPGDIVTFSYDNYSRKEVPVNPKIIRIRSDMSWQDVIKNDASERGKKI